MPVAQTDPKQSGQHLQVRVARNDSLRSERSDKRVSFNNDVGVKHIPRGQKENNNSHPVQKTRKDEWSNCAPVYLEKPALSSQELEKQAEDLVRLLDQVDCVSASKPIHHPAYTPRSLERAKNKNKTSVESKNNQNVLNNSEKKNILVNGVNDISLGVNRTTNPIGKANKDNINLIRNHHSNNLKREVNPAQDKFSAPYEKFSSAYKSVPDISQAIYYNNNNNSQPKTKNSNLLDSDVEDSKNFMSVDNLHDIRGKHFNAPNVYKNRKNRNEYKSADNLTDISIPGSRKLHEYRPYENLQSGFSSTTDIKPNDMEPEFRPKVGNMIKRFNSDSGDPRVKTHPIYLEDSPPRNRRNTNNYYVNNNTKPFSYTSAPLSSVEEIRRLSPSREIHFNNDDSYYSQVNKPDRRARSNSREYDHNSKTTDSDYSAKIIITGNNVHSRYDDDDDDDHAYETYQIGGSPFEKHMREFGVSADDFYDDYKNHSNNNINMSSIGVQTERLPKAPQRSRRNQHSESPVRHSYNGYGYREDLPSASLVRRINHGFGRVDRSPSPPPVKRSSANRLPRNVVPLLSDTDDSEFDYQRRMDPLAKIRNQVMIREKLQEEKEAEELEEREAEFFERRNKSVLNLNSSEMQPLTVDEVDALTLEVDKKGRNTLVVAHEKSHNDSRTKNEYHRTNKHESKLNNEKSQTIQSRGRKSSPAPKGSKERSLSPRLFSTLERLKKNNSDKDKSTLEKNKSKDKKKKKIKIKFFYDPRPQDKANEDPLERFTEYKGSYSDDQESPKQRRQSLKDEDEPYAEYYAEKRSRTNASREYHSLSRDNKAKTRNYSRDSSESPSRVDSGPVRPARSSSRGRSADRSLDRVRNKTQYNRDSSNERTLRKDNRDTLNNRFRPSSRSDYDSTIEKRGLRDRKNNRDKTNYVKNNNEFEKRTQYNNLRSETRFVKSRTDQYDRENDTTTYIPKTNDYDETDHHDSSDQGPSLSEKYRSLNERTSLPREKNVLKSNERSPSRNSVEDSDRKDKIQRQRKKFFGVLLGEGKTKAPAPAPPSGAKVVSSTLPRTSQSNKEAPATPQSNTLHRLPQDDEPNPINDSTKDKKKKPIKRKAPKKPKRQRPWPWSLLKLKGDPSQRAKSRRSNPPRSSRASSRASSRGSSAPRRPSVRSSKIRKDAFETRSYISRDREADDREKKQWESATLGRPSSKAETSYKGGSSVSNTTRPSKGGVGSGRKYSGDSSPPSSTATPRRTNRGAPAPSARPHRQRFFGDTDTEGSARRGRATPPAGGDYRSLPIRKSRAATNGSRQNVMVTRRGVGGVRKAVSPGARGSAGSSLQSSESEADSHGGSHASRASHVSTGSNRSVYLHATAVADIPVRRSSDEAPSDKGGAIVSRQSKKVSRSFSLVSPWKPRHYREKYEVEYDNREVRDAREGKKSALPPRPPRKSAAASDRSENSKKTVGRSNTVYKDSKLAGWLRRKKNKEAKGI